LRKQLERQIANNVKENPKTFWNYARNRLKTCPGIGNIEGIDGKVYTSEVDNLTAFSPVFSQPRTQAQLQFLT